MNPRPMLLVAGTLDGPAFAKPPGMHAGACVPDLAGVYEAHFRYVWRCLRSLGVLEAQLEDALQDVFLVVQKRLQDFDGQVELRTWLYAIALRVARKYRSRSGRDAARHTNAAEVLESTAAPGSLEGTAEQNERLILARRALDTLDDDKREVFVLARIEQMAAPEIASVLGIPLNTVYSRLRAARLAFEAEVARLENERTKERR